MQRRCRETADIRRNEKDKWEGDKSSPDKPVCILTFGVRFPSWSWAMCRWVTHLFSQSSDSRSFEDFTTFFAENKFFFSSQWKHKKNTELYGTDTTKIKSSHVQLLGFWILSISYLFDKCYSFAKTKLLNQRLQHSVRRIQVCRWHPPLPPPLPRNILVLES